MATYIATTAFIPTFLDDNGDPLNGGTLESYVANTTTPTPTFTGEAGVSAGDIITLNARGEPQTSGNTHQVWIDSAIKYDFVLKTAAGVIINSPEDVASPLVGSVASALNIAAAKALTTLTDGQALYIRGYTTAGDGGGGMYVYDASSAATANDGTVLALDTLAGRLLHSETTLVTIETFGAKKGGVIDNTAAIQATGDWFESLGGGELYIPDGSFLSSFLTGWDNVTVKGPGTLDFGTTARVTQDIGCITATDKTDFVIDGSQLTNTGLADMLSLRGCTNSGIKHGGIIMTGTSSDTGKGVILTDTATNDSDSCFVHDNDIKSHSSAVFARSADASHEVYNPKITKNRLDGSGFVGGGYVKMDIDVRDFKINDNDFDGSDQADQLVNIQEGVIGGQVLNNTFDGDITATAIRFEEESAGGGNPQDVEDILIGGNTIRTGTGVTFRFVDATPRQARNIKVLDNTFKNCGRRALNDLGTNDIDSLDVQGNTFDNCGDNSAYQPVALETPNLTFSNNRTKGSAAIPSILTGTNAIISNNTFQQDAVSGDRVTLASGSTSQNVNNNIGLKTSGYYLSSNLDATVLGVKSHTFTHDVVNNPDLSRMQGTIGTSGGVITSAVSLRVISATQVEALVSVLTVGTGTFNITLFIAPTLAS